MLRVILIIMHTVRAVEPLDQWWLSREWGDRLGCQWYMICLETFAYFVVNQAIIYVQQIFAAPAVNTRICDYSENVNCKKTR